MLDVPPAGWAAGLEFEVLRDQIPSDWDDLVRRDPLASYFHRSGWWRANLRAQRGSRPLALVARRSGRAVGGIAAVERRLGPWYRVFALPMGCHGGPVIAADAPGGWSEQPALGWWDDEAVAWRQGTALGAALALRLFELPRLAEVHLADASAAAGERLAFLPGVSCTFPRQRLLDLRPGPQHLWHQLSAKCRNKIRRAERDAVEVQKVAHLPAGIESLLGILAEVEPGRRPQVSAVLLRALAATESRQGIGPEVWIAHAGGRPIAALLNLVCAGRAQNHMAVSGPAGRVYAAHNLLHWRAISAAAAAGCRIYDFGAAEGLPGVDAFKASFGAVASRIHVWRRLHPVYRLLRERR